MPRRNRNQPAPGYVRVCVDLHKSQIRFIAERIRLESAKLERRITRSDVIREALVKFKNGEL